jgi:hypothetical protein
MASVMRWASLGLVASMIGCSCNGSGAAVDAGPAEYFGVIPLVCFEYVIGNQTKPAFDLGVVDFETDTTGQSCPSLADLDGGIPEVHEVRYYSGTLQMIDYFYAEGNELHSCRRDYEVFSGDTFYFHDDGLAYGRVPAKASDRIQSTTITEVRNQSDVLVYSAPATLGVDTSDQAGFLTPHFADGGVDATRYADSLTVADAGTPNAPAAGTPIFSENRYFVAGIGWAGLDIAVDSPTGAQQQYRLQAVRIIPTQMEALNYPCGGLVPDGG